MSVINFSGLASGIDSSALIQATLEKQRIVSITPFENEIADKEATNTALDELKQKLLDLNSSLQAFRSINGGVIAKQALSSNESVLTSIASNSASSGSYGLEVLQLAKNATFSFNDRFGSSTETINSSINDGAAAIDRTVSFTIGTGGDAEDIDLVLSSTTTAAQFVSAFNEASDKAVARLVNVGTESTPDYAILIQSNEEGTEEGTITLNSVGSEILSAGSGAFTATQLEQAQDLNFTLDGIAGTITRTSNTVSDIIAGVTFTAEDLGTATITVKTDAEKTTKSVKDFVEKYNELIKLIKENDAVSEDPETKLNVFGPLAATSIDETIINGLKEAISGAGISGQTINILADMGLTTERDGTLLFDEDEFKEALDSDPNSVDQILSNLGEQLGSVNGTIAQYTRFNGLISEATKGNDSRIRDLQSRIETLEDALSKQESSMVQQFSRLEAQISKLQSQQNAISSILPVS